MNNKTSIDLNANVSGEMNPNDPDYNEKGQIVKYTYEIKYIRIPNYFTTITNNTNRYARDPNPTELKEQALALASPTNIDPPSEKIEMVTSTENINDVRVPVKKNCY